MALFAHVISLLIKREYRQELELLQQEPTPERDYRYDLLTMQGRYQDKDTDERRRIWNLWRRGAGEKVKPLFKRRTFSDLELVGFNLSLCTLSGVVMEKVSMAGANLRGARFIRGKIDAVFSGADLSGATFESIDAEGLEFAGAKLKGTTFIRTRLNHAMFEGADLRGAHLEDAFLVEADLTDADLRGAHLDRAQLMDADLAGADLRGASFDDAVLAGATFEQANTYGARFIRADLQDVDMNHFDVAGVIMTGVKHCAFSFGELQRLGAIVQGEEGQGEKEKRAA